MYCQNVQKRWCKIVEVVQKVERVKKGKKELTKAEKGDIIIKLSQGAAKRTKGKNLKQTQATTIESQKPFGEAKEKTLRNFAKPLDKPIKM